MIGDQGRSREIPLDLGCWNWWVLRDGSSLAGRDRRSAKQEIESKAFGWRDRDLSEKFGGVTSQTWKFCVPSVTGCLATRTLFSTVWGGNGRHGSQSDRIVLPKGSVEPQHACSGRLQRQISTVQTYPTSPGPRLGGCRQKPRFALRSWIAEKAELG